MKNNTLTFDDMPYDAMSAELKNDISAFIRKTQSVSTLELAIQGAKCGGCISKIEHAITNLIGITHCRFNLSNGRLTLKWTGSLSGNTIVETIEKLGFGVSPFVENNEETVRKKEEHSLLLAMGVSGFAMANIMLLSVAVWSGGVEMGNTTRMAMHVISAMIALPVLIFSGRHFFSSAWRALQSRNVNMDVPISLALILAFITSIVNTIRHTDDVYFDAVVMLLFFLLIGRFLDARLRRRAYAAANELSSLKSSSMLRIKQDGTTQSVRAQDLSPNDKVMLVSGELSCVNFLVESSGGQIDESYITGESLPKNIKEGYQLYAGTLNLGAPLTGTVTATADDSLLSEISSLLEMGEQRRSIYQKIADRAVKIYVPFVHTMAILAFVGWLIAGASFSIAMMIAVTTLIITCPCALALATPVTHVTATSELFKKGIFIKSGDALERFSEIDHIILDKTGTLTLGTPQLIHNKAVDEHLNFAAMLARSSRHPLSKAIVAEAGNGPLGNDLIEIAGQGVSATINGEVYKLGSYSFVMSSKDAGTSVPGNTSLSFWFRKGDDDPVQFLFADSVREEATSVINQLRVRNIDVEILSGDQINPVKAMADSLGIETWTALAKPAQKAERLEELRRKGKRTLMVGDGLNDAGALSLAHASLAPGSALDISQAASDGVFNGGLRNIVDVLDLAKNSQKILKQNFSFAALYNVFAVPVAILGFVTPLIAAIAMSGSSIIVTLNACRLRYGEREVK